MLKGIHFSFQYNLFFSKQILAFYVMCVFWTLQMEQHKCEGRVILQFIRMRTDNSFFLMYWVWFSVNGVQIIGTYNITLSSLFVLLFHAGLSSHLWKRQLSKIMVWERKMLNKCVYNMSTVLMVLVLCSLSWQVYKENAIQKCKIIPPPLDS